MIYQFDTQKEDELTLTKLAEIFDARARNSMHLAAGVPEEYAPSLERSAETSSSIAAEIRDELASRKAARDRMWSEIKSRMALRRQQPTPSTDAHEDHD